MVYEPVIGLEIHVELATASKLFCACPVAFAAAPNSLTCPVCLGLPGALPVLNGQAVELAAKAVLALEGRVSGVSRFDRKNYFYPDSPKGYQISQQALPLGQGGRVMVQGEGIRIQRVHLEEDAGKLSHEGSAQGRLVDATATLIDYNRCGVPLIEIVSEAELRSPDMAQAYLEEVKRILEYAGVSDCRMEQGSLRVDCNISLRPVGNSQLGDRVELKNLSSSRALLRALHYEMERQSRSLERGEKVLRETRHWDEAKEVSVAMRSKEPDSDYRYFPDPDLPPLRLSLGWVEELRATLPELPQRRQLRFQEEYRLSHYDASLLTSTRTLADFFEAVVGEGIDAKSAANWIMGELLHHLNQQSLDVTELPFGPAQMAKLLQLAEGGRISRQVTKQTLAVMCQRGIDPVLWIEEQGLSQINDAARLSSIVDEVVAHSPSVVDSYREGKHKVLGHLLGQVMQATQGRANPRLVNQLLRQRLSGEEFRTEDKD